MAKTVPKSIVSPSGRYAWTSFAIAAGNTKKNNSSDQWWIIVSFVWSNSSPLTSEREILNIQDATGTEIDNIILVAFSAGAGATVTQQAIPVTLHRKMLVPPGGTIVNPDSLGPIQVSVVQMSFDDAVDHI